MRSVLRDVYDNVAAPSEDADRRFFSRVRLPSGVFKTTEAHRLDDVNGLAARLLPNDRPLELLDVATSSGITSLEWSEQLAAEGISHHLVAGDSQIEAEWLSFPGVEALLDRDRRHLLFADVFGRGIDVSGGSRKSAMAVRAIKSVARLAGPLRLRVRRVVLVSSRLRDCPTVSVIEDDIFAARQDLAGRFHAVRAANILNRSYFDDDQLRAAIANLRDRLRPDGLLIVCRTHADGTNHGTFLRLTDRGWVVVARIGDGSEIEALINSEPEE
jgi:hypothetical protein